MRRPLRTFALLGLATFGLGAAACEDSSSASPDVAPPPVGTTPPGTTPPGTTPPGEPPPPEPGVTVTVVRGGAPLAGVRVFFHDEAGALLATGGQHVTDASGVVSQATAPKMVTVMVVARDSRALPDVDLVTYSGVEDGDRLVVDATPYFGLSEEDRTYAATLGGTLPAGAVDFQLAVGRSCGLYTSTPEEPAEVFVDEGCLRPQNNILLARAYGAGGEVLGYAAKKGLAVPAPGTPLATTLDGWAAPALLTVGVSNPPEGEALDYFRSEAVAISGGNAFLLHHAGGDGPIDGYRYAVPAAGFAEAHQAAIFDQSPLHYGVRALVTRAAFGSAITIDHAKNLPFVLSTELVEDGARPEATWTTERPIAGDDAADVAIARMTWAVDGGEEGSGFRTWTLVGPGDASSFKAPELPADVELVSPDEGYYLDLAGVVLVDSSAAASYREIKRVPVLPDYFHVPDVGRPLPADGTLRASARGLYLAMSPPT